MTTRYLAHIEAAICESMKPILPQECDLDQPLEDVDEKEMERQGIDTLNQMVAALFAEAGRDFNAELAAVGREADRAKGLL